VSICEITQILRRLACAAPVMRDREYPVADFGLNQSSFERVRQRLAETVATQAGRLAKAADAEGWVDPVLERIRVVIAERAVLMR
jgi:hypothetical protein